MFCPLLVRLRLYCNSKSVTLNYSENIASDGSILNDIVWPVTGCLNESLWLQRAMALGERWALSGGMGGAPYLVSPAMGQLRYAMVALIWWKRPVKRCTSIRDLLLFELIILYSSFEIFLSSGFPNVFSSSAGSPVTILAFPSDFLMISSSI